MGKLSNISVDTTPALTDHAVGVKTPGSTPAARRTTWTNIFSLLSGFIAARDALTGAQTAADDEFLINDQSADVVKRITRDELRTAMAFMGGATFYAAVINQSGEAAPTVQEMYDSVDMTLTAGRDSAGHYTLTRAAGSFLAAKTLVLCSGASEWATTTNTAVSAHLSSDSTISLVSSTDWSSGDEASASLLIVIFP
jgi:hypothetical protein